jgi:hypothetical protein
MSLWCHVHKNSALFDLHRVGRDAIVPTWSVHPVVTSYRQPCHGYVLFCRYLAAQSASHSWSMSSAERSWACCVMSLSFRRVLSSTEGGQDGASELPATPPLPPPAAPCSRPSGANLISDGRHASCRPSPTPGSRARLLDGWAADRGYAASPPRSCTRPRSS